MLRYVFLQRERNQRTCDVPLKAKSSCFYLRIGHALVITPGFLWDVILYPRDTCKRRFWLSYFRHDELLHSKGGLKTSLQEYIDD